MDVTENARDTAVLSAEKQKKGFNLRDNAAFNYVMLALLGVGVGLISLLLGAAVYGVPLFMAYFSSPAVILLNLLPPVILIFLVYYISGRAWIAFAFPSLLVLLLSAVGFFKLQIRGDPFVAVDMALAHETGNIISAYTLTMNWKLYFALAVYICGVIFCLLFLRRKVKRHAVRIIGSAAAAVVIVILYLFVYKDVKIYNEIKGGFEAKEGSFAESYISKGFMYPFIHSIRHTFPETPEGYSKGEAKKLLGGYVSGEIQSKVNIISIMLEAYTDLSQFGALDFELPVYDALHRLQQESVSGSLIVNTFGGGTIDSERLFLTGNTKLTNYSSSTDSFVHYLKSQGYYAEGLHAGDSWFYDRTSVNQYLGFDNYYFLENYENSTRWDSFFFPAVWELYTSRDKSKPYFSYNLSYQNHGAYADDWTEEPYLIERGDLSEQAFNILNNYLAGIYDTTLRIEGLIDSLRRDPEPVIVVLFGDHMPWLGNSESVYNELGINVDKSTDEGFYNYYSTPYVIWANDAAKAELNNDFTGDGGSFSPCFLMSEVFRLCSWDGDGYMQALSELKSYTDIISSPTGLFRENGKLTLELSEDAKKAYNKLKTIEYYRLHNFNQ